MNETTQLGDLLKGCELILDMEGKPIIQSIRNMEIAFLTTKDEFTRPEYGDPLQVVFTNRSYGHLHTENRTDAPVVLPAQLAVFEQGAQNHAMTKAAFLRAMGIKDFNDAGCIEGLQPGQLSGRNTVVRFVPLLMREALLRDAWEGIAQNYRHIYPHIQIMGGVVGFDTGLYLNRFFEKFEGEIDTFIAHFERPPRCIGVIVMVGGEIVAIDKWPNFNYAEWLWDLVVRDCYGSLAIALEKHTLDKSSVKIDAHVPKHADETTVDFLRRCVGKALEDRNKLVVDSILELERETFSSKLDANSDPNPSSFLLDSQNFMGQVISDAGLFLSVSLVKKGLTNPETLQEMSTSRRLARAIANRQEKFTAREEKG